MPALKIDQHEQVAQLLAHTKRNKDICEVTGLNPPAVTKLTNRKDVRDRSAEIMGLQEKTQAELELEAELLNGTVSTEFQIRTITADIAVARKAQNFGAVASLSSLLARVTGSIRTEAPKSTEKERLRQFSASNDAENASAGVMLTDDHLTMILEQLNGVTTPEEHRIAEFERFTRVLIKADCHNWANYTGHQAWEALKAAYQDEYGEAIKIKQDELDAVYMAHHERATLPQTVDLRRKTTSRVPPWVKTKQPQVIVRVAKSAA